MNKPGPLCDCNTDSQIIEGRQIQVGWKLPIRVVYAPGSYSGNERGTGRQRGPAPSNISATFVGFFKYVSQSFKRFLHSSPLSVRQHETFAVERMEEFRLKSLVNGLAKIGHIHIHNIRSGVKGIAPYLFGDSRTGQDPLL